MAYRDLREFVAALRERGLLREISARVDPELEITAIADRVVKAGGPALLFHDVAGSSMPVLVNAFGSDERMCLALGVSSLDEIGERISKLFSLKVPGTFVGKLRELGKLRDLAALPPKLVGGRPPCQEVVVRGDEVDLGAIPILKCWPKDAGRFVTLPMVITKHPETGERNVGMYRLQVFDRNTLGMHWQIHKDGAEHYRQAEKTGARLPVAVAIGADPVLTYAATAPLPGIDEFVFAGFLRRERVELTPAMSVPLEVPAHAEIVLEGYVDPGERRVEGPFGDHTGHYTPPEPFPVFHVETITRRRDPIYHATVVGIPPMEDCFLGKATERIFLPLLRMQIPEIVDIDLPFEGVFHNCVLVSIDKRFPMQARKVMHALWGLGMLSLSKAIVVVDSGVDVHDHSAVAFHALSNIDPRRDLVFSEGPVDHLDHSAPQQFYGSKVGVDATAKWPSEGHERPWPELVAMDPAVTGRVVERWAELGLEGILP